MTFHRNFKWSRVSNALRITCRSVLWPRRSPLGETLIKPFWPGLGKKNVHAPKYILPFEIYQNSWKILPLHLVLSIFEIKSSFVIHLSIVLSRLQPLYTVAEEKFRVNELDFSQKACKQACSSTLKGSFGDIASHSG